MMKIHDEIRFANIDNILPEKDTYSQSLESEDHQTIYS